MTRNLLTLLMFAGLIGYSSFLTAQEKFAIQSRFEPGRYVQTLVVDNDTVTRFGDLDAEDGIAMKQEQKIKHLLDVSKPDDNGTQKLELTFAEIQMNQTMMGMEMVYDSTDEDLQDPNLSPMFNAMLGSKLTFDLTEDGKTGNFKGLDDLWEKIFNNMPEGAGVMLEPMKEKMSDEMFSGMLGGIENQFGSEPRAVGEQWTGSQTQNTPFLGKSVIESIHTLKSVKDDVAVVATEGTVRMQGGDSLEMGTLKMNFEKGDMSITTTTSINVKTGLPFEICGKTEMDLTAGMDVSGNATKMKMRITSTIITTMTIEKVASGK